MLMKSYKKNMRSSKLPTLLILKLLVAIHFAKPQELNWQNDLPNFAEKNPPKILASAVRKSPGRKTRK